MSKRFVWGSGAFRPESQHKTPPRSVSLRIFSIFLKTANSEIDWSWPKKKSEGQGKKASRRNAEWGSYPGGCCRLRKALWSFYFISFCKLSLMENPILCSVRCFTEHAACLHFCLCLFSLVVINWRTCWKRNIFICLSFGTEVIENGEKNWNDSMACFL